MSNLPSGRVGGRHDRLLIVAGVVLVLSAVAAGFVIFAGDSGTTRAASGRLHVAVEDGALVLGRAGARHTVVVTEDFGSADCRTFDIATRDFLRADATAGLVKVTYRPQQGASAYSATAWSRWSDTATGKRASSALRLHAQLYDRQPSGAGGGPPTVRLDGKPLDAATIHQLADRLERALAGR